MLLSAEADAATHVERLRRASYQVTNVERKERKRSPSPPFTTSTLQQEAARKLGFGARKTMSVAQRLYEGIDLPGEGSVGLITYMRTDSVTIADTALREIAELVKTEYGKEYTLAEFRRYKTKSRNAQEAHEAMRPTSVMRTPQRMASVLDRDQLRLYTLIWQRTMATQMAEARFNQVGDRRIAADPTATSRTACAPPGQTMIFDGFIRVYKEGRDEGPDEDAEKTLPELTAEQLLRMLEVLPEQHFTQPPPRYSEASLVKTLEELGIGRPSTYASIIDTIQRRQYVTLEDKRFTPTDIGEVVTDKLIEHFPDVVDVKFTAYMEKELDDIAEGDLGKVQMLHEFNGPFERALEKAEHSFERFSEELDEECPLCPTEGRDPGKLEVKLGRYGKFIGCTNYPDCKYIRNMDGSVRPEPEMLDELCPECGKQLQKRVGRFGPFIGCSGYPDCKYIKKDPPVSTGVICPQCKQGELIEKRSRFGTMFYSCSRYPDCDCAVGNPPEKDHPCPAVRVPPAAAAQVTPVLGLRRRAGPGLQRHEGRRRRGGDRGAPSQGHRQGGARRREEARRQEVDRQEADEEEVDREEVHDQPRRSLPRRSSRRPRRPRQHRSRPPRDRRRAKAQWRPSPTRSRALRGTRAATLKDLLTHPAFSRLLAAMSGLLARATGWGSWRSRRW